MPEKKSDKVRAAVASGDWKKALSIAKTFRRGITKEQSDAMAVGYECMVHPKFYQSIGTDLDAAIAKGISVVTKLYGKSI